MDQRKGRIAALSFLSGVVRSLSTWHGGRGSKLQAPSATDVNDMSSVSGTTSNAFSYEGEYAAGARGRVTWSATYRDKDGAFFGMRNGQLEQMEDISASDMDAAVRAAIELRWAGM